MKFLFILTHVESAWRDAPAGEAERAFQQYKEFEHQLKLGGKMLETVRLRPCSEARTARNLPESRREFVEGPWSDSKEVMGGYYKIECDSMQEALDLAGRLPNYGHGSIEIRPIWE